MRRPVLVAVGSLGLLAVVVAVAVAAGWARSRTVEAARLAADCGSTAADAGRRIDACGRLCASGSEPECLVLGELLSADPGRRADATRVWRRACERMSAIACRRLGDVLDGSVADRKQAYERACQGGDVAGCGELGRLLGQGSEGKEPDRRRATELLVRACDTDDPRWCGELADLLAKGPRAEQEERRVRSLHLKACRLGWARSCAWLGDRYDRAGEGSSRVALYERACTLGSSTGCYQHAALLRDGGWMRDPGRKETLGQLADELDRACLAGVAGACHSLAELAVEDRGVPRNLQNVQALFERGCQGSHAPSCEALGKRLASGEVSRPDAARIAQTVERACTKEHPEVCGALADAYASGSAVEKSPERAAALFARACEGNSPLGCCRAAAFYFDSDRELARRFWVRFNNTPLPHERPGCLGRSHRTRAPTIRRGATSSSSRLSEAYVQAKLFERFDAYQRCGRDWPGSVRRVTLGLRFVIGRDGLVSNVEITDGADVPTMVQACATVATEQLRFSPPEGGIVVVKYPLELRLGR